MPASGAISRGPRTRSRGTALVRSVTHNLDILQIMLSFLPRGDLLSASCTSRFMRQWTIKELLSRPSSIGLPKELESWCRFVLADENRPACVRDLFIHLEELQSIGKRRAKLLLKFLQRATRLRRLYIGWGEAVFDADPGLPSAISRLPALESFSVDPFCHDAQATTNDVVAEMTSCLKFLSLHQAYHPFDDRRVWEYDIPRMLAPHREHLEELHLDFPDRRALELCYPHLHTLKIAVTPEQPRPSSMFTAFPGLRHLSLSQAALDDIFDFIPEDTYPASRQSRMSEQTDGRVWSSLDTLQGPLMDVYMAGLICPVRRLEIRQYRPTAHEAAIDVVKSASPQKLVLDIRCEVLDMGRLCEPRLLVPASPDRQHVTHLTLRVCLDDPVPFSEDPLKELLPLLRDSKIEYFRLVFGGAYMNEDHLEDERFIDKQIKQGIRALDLGLIRDSLVEAATTLRVLAFTIAIRGQTVWTIDRSGETTTTTEVDPVVARELIQREEA